MTAGGPGTPTGSGADRRTVGGVGAGLVGLRQRGARAAGRARRRPSRRRCGGCRRRPGRGCPARRRARARCRSRGPVCRGARRRPAARRPPGTGQGPVRVDRALTAVEPCRAVRPGWLRPRRRRPSPSAASSAGGVALGGLGVLVGLLALDAGLGLGLGELGLEGLLRRPAAVTLTTRASSSVTSVGALGQLDLAGEDLGAGLEALDGDDDVLGDVRWPATSSWRVWAVDGDDGLGGGLALEVHGDVDGDLLAALRTMTRSMCSMTGLIGVALDVLGQGELLLAVDDDGEQGVALLERHHRLVAGQGDVHRLGCRGRT